MTIPNIKSMMVILHSFVTRILTHYYTGVSTEPASSPPPVASGSSGGSTSSSFRRSQYENLASSLDTHGFELCKSPELEEDAAGVDGDADELELYFGKGKGRA